MINVYKIFFLSLLFISHYAAAQETDFELNEITVEELNKAFDSGKYTSVKVVRLYLERIKELNKKGPHLNAIISVNPKALVIAEMLDKERQKGEIRGPLHGIPVLLKDNIDTADDMPTTAGSIALKSNFAKKDSPLAASLRQAGAIILGKANLSEWANFRSTNSSSGWSGIGGQTRNPYLLTANTCGSSSGSGVAAAANLATLTIGTETDGSIVCPAAYNGIVGIKPTVGLVSRTGIIPIAAAQDTAGPMTRTVSDGAYLLTAMVTKNSEDPATLSQPNTKINYEKYLNKDGLKGKRIGVIRSPFRMHQDLPKIFEDNINLMESKGAEIIDNLEFGNRDGIGEAEGIVLRYEFKHYLNAYLENTPDTVSTKSLADLIAFNIERQAEEMPYFNQEIFVGSEVKGPLSDKNYINAISNSKNAMIKLIDDLMDQHDLDLIVMPSRNPANSQDLINGDHPSGGGTSSYAAVSGYPSITVPMGFIHALPVSLSFVGRKYSEAMLIEVAYAFEQVSQSRKKPKFLQYLYK